MSGTSNDSEDGMLYDYHSESMVMDDGSGGSSGGGVILKKGPWTATEDAILMEYVKKHGEGNWNAVQKHSGLSRCGKSCRLRWANHLRPNLKKGAFSPGEENMILELHAKLGNKWARMASYLPGRTDNEIKNYWNTRVKRRLRAGLPLYPNDIRALVIQDNLQAENAGSLCCGESRQHEALQANNALEAPTVRFDGFTNNPAYHAFDSELQHHLCCLGQQTIQPQDCIRESSDALMKVLPHNVLYDDGSFTFGEPFFDEDDPVLSLSYLDAAQGLHSLLNGNPSASVPVNGVVKSELPSLQYHDTDLNHTWGNSSPLPSLESVDAFIRSPAQANGAQFGPTKRENSGLLEDMIQEGMQLSNFSEKSLNLSSFTPADGILGTFVNEWNGKTDPPSPLGQSEASFLNEYISPFGSSFDDMALDEHLTGNLVKQEPLEMVFTPSKENESKKPMELIQSDNESKKPMELIRPNTLPDPDWSYCSSVVKGRETMTDAIATLMGSDLVSDFNFDLGFASSSSVQDWSYGRCLWDTMPSAVCQMSDRH